jgi:hypothetical protein
LLFLLIICWQRKTTPHSLLLHQEINKSNGEQFTIAMGEKEETFAANDTPIYLHDFVL